ncbi:MAG: HD domain-containing protein [Pseudomonadales bacterium]
MVSQRNSLPRLADGTASLNEWLLALPESHPQLDHEQLRTAAALLSQTAQPDEIEQGLQMANLVLDMNLDADSVLAALYYRAVRVEQLSLDEAMNALPAAAGSLLSAVLRMASVRLLRLSNTRLQTSEAGDQVSNIRAMVTALIDDVRVALIKLAERVVALRCAKTSPRQRQIRIAQESQRVFAPLAGRLGIWHLKWELEDLALRYLDPEAYRSIAGQLDGRRADREQRVAQVAEEVRLMLSEAGIEVEVHARAKHIYSIWKKMQDKQLSFNEVYDVRAVRVLLPNIAQCYAALGLIHTRWSHVPSEFDDYIAVPKDNGYRSIHTAVRDDQEKTLEVQIRTHEMHREAELGVCAHWAYKGDDSAGDESTAHSADPYSDKLDWLRQTLEWQDTLAWSEGLADLLDSGQAEQRVFVYTPAGHVIDLLQGSTAIDFAYRVHTQVGHSCIGALIDGRPVPLQRPLRNGERVEILRSSMAQPSMDWLDYSLGFARTARAREKIEDFWRNAPHTQTAAVSRARFARLLEQLGWPMPTPAQLQQACAPLGEFSDEALFYALGTGDLPLFDVMVALERQGFGGQLALISSAEQSSVRTQLAINGENRDGLLRDVALLLSEQQVALLSTLATGDESGSAARMLLKIETLTFPELLRILVLLLQVPGVTDVRRVLT